MVLYFASRGRRMATEGMAYVAVAALIGGVLGARIAQWLVSGGVGDPFNPTAGGRTVIGAVFGGWIAVEFMKRRLGIRRSTGDMFALALPAGEAVGRIGCFLNGCCYGAESDVAWAIYQHGALRHPTQFYSAGWATIVFLALAVYRPRVEGDRFWLYILLFAAGRFVIEFFRQHETLRGGLSLAQWVCLEAAVLVSVAWSLRHRRVVLMKEAAADGR
jgi:phosphatidylglycerol:prolipoprotein diacylglycerol transferase